ncbi:hypothetical protein WR25_09968 [Diploscapter pachys]|uniref:Uncharacterized protein n=1 Tax=Diploscapter pachys TaxID=2018661 RepID=A0A2A2KQV0_9BILA|nr:hypothetical protein WR25_09968 [Diploscapter pachys]
MRMRPLIGSETVRRAGDQLGELGSAHGHWVATRTGQHMPGRAVASVSHRSLSWEISGLWESNGSLRKRDQNPTNQTERGLATGCRPHPTRLYKRGERSAARESLFSL